MPVYFDLLLDEPLDPAQSPRDQKRTLARSHHRAAARLGGRGHAPRRTSTGSTWSAGVPDDVEEHAFSSDNGTVHLPALLADAFGLSRSEGRRLLAQAGVRLDGEPLEGEAVDLPAARLDGAVLQVGRRRFKRLRQL